jgi:AhpD family alkylhydroperoxidase
MEEAMSQTQTRGPRLSPDASRSPDAVAGVQQIMKSIYAGGVPRQTLDLVHLRASQINGCNGCIAGGVERALAALVSMIALTNFFNRVNTTLRTQ